MSLTNLMYAMQYEMENKDSVWYNMARTQGMFVDIDTNCMVRFFLTSSHTVERPSCKKAVSAEDTWEDPLRTRQRFVRLFNSFSRRGGEMNDYQRFLYFGKHEPNSIAFDTMSFVAERVVISGCLRAVNGRGYSMFATEPNMKRAASDMVSLAKDKERIVYKMGKYCEFVLRRDSKGADYFLSHSNREDFKKNISEFDIYSKSPAKFSKDKSAESLHVDIRYDDEYVYITFYATTPDGFSFGFADRTFLTLAQRVAARTIGIDLVPVQQMAPPAGKIAYLDFDCMWTTSNDGIYGSGKHSLSTSIDAKIVQSLRKREPRKKNVCIPSARYGAFNKNYQQNMRNYAARRK